MPITRKLIVEQPNYELDFETIQENRETDQRLYIIGQYLMLNRKNKNGRVYEESEMMPAIKLFQEDYINNGRAGGELNHCVPDNYKILTSNGWKVISDIDDTESVVSLNTDTSTIEVSPISSKIHDDYKGKMYHIKGRNIDLKMTPNHRVLIVNRSGQYEYYTAEQLFLEWGSSKIDHSYIPKTGFWSATSPKTFTLPGIKNAIKIGNYKNDITKDIDIDYNTFLSFLGLYLAEGHTEQDGYLVHIAQKKLKYMDQIEEMLNKFPSELNWKKVKTGFRCIDRRLAEYCQNLNKVYTKYIPESIKNNSSSEDLADLIYWFNIGDGRFNLINEKYTVRNVFTVSRTLIDDLNECVLKSGISGNISVIDPGTEDITIEDHIVKAENRKPLFLLNLSKVQGIYLDSRFLTMSEINYDGKIGCVTTVNSNWYCMDDSGKCYWTGNSDKPDMDLERLAHKITSLTRESPDSNYYIGKSMVLSSPFGKILESHIKDGMRFGMSSKCLGQIQESSDGNRVKSPIILGVDAVYDPSIGHKFVNGILENREYIIGDDGKIAESYKDLDKRLSKFPSKDRDVINQYIFESMKKFLASI